MTTTGFFAVLVAVIASLAFFAGRGAAEAVAPGVIWIAVAFSSVLALSRTWQREREDNALAGLLSTPISRSAIFAGKALGVCAFITVVELVIIPITALFFGVDLLVSGPGLAILALAATPGIAASGTLFAAMTVRTRARDLVLASVLFPLLAPTLLAAVAGTRDLPGWPLARRARRLHRDHGRVRRDLRRRRARPLRRADGRLGWPGRRLRAVRGH